MVAGMLMPLERLRAILELLFREGVLVAEKDPRPRRPHPQLPGVANVEVLRAMALAALPPPGARDLRLAPLLLVPDGRRGHLPAPLPAPAPEIVPLSLQRPRRPAEPPGGPSDASGPGRARAPPRSGSTAGRTRPSGTRSLSPRRGEHPGCPPSPARPQMNETGSRKKPSPNGVNKHLIKAQRHVNDLYEDLRDGHNLISLLEVLSGDTLPREKGRMRFHKLQNVQIALNYLKHRQVKLVNIRNDDIADGNPKLTLGLIWTIILHFQISDIQVTGQSEDMTAQGEAAALGRSGWWRITRACAATTSPPAGGTGGSSMPSSTGTSRC
ncbi:unnamed protein product [Bubo scandiacus]